MGSTERPKKRTQLCKKAVVHFSLCFIMGFFTGFAPTGKSSISAAPSNRTEFVSPPITSQIAHRTFNLSRNLVAEPPPAAPREERKRKEEPKIKPRRQIIIVTPTRSRDRFREVGLRRLANTIRLVRQPLLWIVVEAKRDSSNLAEIMRKTGIMYRHLVFKENFTDSEAEMNHQRNVALKHIEHHRLSGIVHFAGLSNFYDLRFFDELREIEYDFFSFLFFNFTSLFIIDEGSTSISPSKCSYIFNFLYIIFKGKKKFFPGILILNLSKNF